MTLLPALLAFSVHLGRLWGKTGSYISEHAAIKPNKAPIIDDHPKRDVRQEYYGGLVHQLIHSCSLRLEGLTIPQWFPLKGKQLPRCKSSPPVTAFTRLVADQKATETKANATSFIGWTRRVQLQCLTHSSKYNNNKTAHGGLCNAYTPDRPPVVLVAWRCYILIPQSRRSGGFNSTTLPISLAATYMYISQIT